MTSKNKEHISLFAKIIVIFGAVCAGVLLLWTTTFSMPDLSSFDDRRVAQSTKIYDRTGEHILYEFHKDVKRTVIPFEDISRYAKNATIAIEDEDFYSHFGFKPGAFLRAAWVNLKTGEFTQGGSTITQQVVKNALLTNKKTIARKLEEIILAIKLDKTHSKDEILSMYLNEIPYGGNIYGIEEASRRFFNKSAKDLTLAESAYLAAIPQAPTYYSPYGNNVDKLEARKNLVLSKMKNLGFISDEEYNQAKGEEVIFQDQDSQGIAAPHFVFFIGEYLEKKYGPSALNEGGLKVITTLDYDLQKKAEEIVKKHALSNQTNFNAENAALVAIDPLTGHILTMVGSRDYFDTEIPGKFNVAIAHRQPGSAFKPFVYATAFKKGYTPETIVFDLRTQFSTACSPSNFTSEGNCYSPDNYDHKFAGPIALRDALAQSKNVPAVKTLYLAGLQDSLRTARDMGINSLTSADRYGLTLVLGGGEVSLLDMTSAYAVFANDGIRNPYTGIIRVEDAQGNVLEEYEQDESRVLDAQVARQITDILSDNEARAPAFGTNSYLYFPGHDVAAKTGTTNDTRDAWVMGYTPRIVVGAWAGNNDNTPMVKNVAGYIIAPLWNEFMQEVLKEYPDERFKRPRPTSDDIKPVLRGDLAGMGAIHDILHWVIKDNPQGPLPSNPASDPQYSLWEYPVSMWGGGYGSYTNNNSSNGNNVDFTFTGLESSYDEGDTIHFGITNSQSVLSMQVYIDNALIGTLITPPFEFAFIPSVFGINDGRYELKAVITNTSGNTSTIERTIRIRD